MTIKKMLKLKAVLLLCLVWVCVFAAPAVQGQTATAITCDATNTLADATTYELTADCAGTSTSIVMASGAPTATLNGNGYTISGVTARVIFVTGGATLNLNDITISGTTHTGPVVEVYQSTLNANNLVIRDSSADTALRFGGANTAGDLTNVRFLNNAAPTENARIGSALTVWGASGTVDLNGATFTGNSGHPQVVRVNEGTLNLSNCIRSGNTGLFSATETNGTITGSCSPPPKKKKKKETPVPTATERPPTPSTCMGLHEATGIVVRATFGLASGVQCQQLDGGGIGIQSLADNYILAVDIWGYVDQGIEVCFPGAGQRIIFLDARTSPRAMALMSTHGAEAGITCGSTETPGAFVLLPAG